MLKEEKINRQKEVAENPKKDIFAIFYTGDITQRSHATRLCHRCRNNTEFNRRSNMLRRREMYLSGSM
jgi:hypothetical protein